MGHATCPTARPSARPALRSGRAPRLLPSATLLGGVPQARAATEIRPRITGIQPLTHEVYGYLPYWRLDAGTVDRINYDLVSTIAFFGLGIKSTGASIATGSATRNTSATRPRP